jgi:hypothetical protein
MNSKYRVIPNAASSTPFFPNDPSRQLSAVDHVRIQAARLFKTLFKVSGYSTNQYQTLEIQALDVFWDYRSVVLFACFPLFSEKAF